MYIYLLLYSILIFFVCNHNLGKFVLLYPLLNNQFYIVLLFLLLVLLYMYIFHYLILLCYFYNDPYLKHILYYQYDLSILNYHI